MEILVRKIVLFIRNLIYKMKVSILFEFKVKPKIIEMKNFVRRIVSSRSEYFPIGKSLFIFDGKDDTIYFIIYKESLAISVMEVYDEILNRIPDRYQILPKVRFNDLLVSA